MHIVAITDYPRLAWIAQASGDVVVRCLLNKDGSVAKAEVLSGHGLLKEKTEQNAILWRFRLNSSRKMKREEFVTMTYRYRLEGDRKDNPHASFSVDLPNTVHVVAPFPVPMID